MEEIIPKADKDIVNIASILDITLHPKHTRLEILYGGAISIKTQDTVYYLDHIEKIERVKSKVLELMMESKD